MSTQNLAARLARLEALLYGEGRTRGLADKLRLLERLVEADAGDVAPGSGDMVRSTYDPNEDGVIAIAQGGTGATSAGGARTALGAEASGAAAAAVAAHEADEDPHAQYALTAGLGALALEDEVESFPVGSVFISVVSTNPATLLGYGTWSAFAAGRMLVGIDSGDSDFDTVEETGGAKTHTLTTGEIPAHSHAINDPGHTHSADVFATDANGANFDRSAGGGAAGTATINSATTGITVDNAGGGAAHNNLPPYVVVYIWKRTA